MKVTALWRHPIKGIGRERLDSVALTAGRPLPSDRAWAVRHDGAAEGEGWQPRGNFVVVASGPGLAAVEAESDGDTVTLRHPELPTARFTLPKDGHSVLDWVRPIWPEARPAPADMVRAPETIGMADNGHASLSILTEASLSALSDAAGQSLDPGRFRGNVLLSGSEPWAEFDWIGKRLRLGDAVLEVFDRIERCRATEANPETGTRDVNTLALLRDTFGHRDFGVYARVIEGGSVATGDAARLEG
ncbi:MOSC domain-containing protein [Palleronia abyssalis]|uniref:MOSC domain-containing protein n=1 Tax=Palleronia abyssalis TaxID=1501240 RepID=A0A2R8BXU2_9RHOB|nr:MOSC domain-containing protein [Palleronia abyssalis]SPJ24981.1 hypothetical protein PAA8504_02824 [Palleronia abyssalis]